MLILGVSCYYHDSAAALIEDGKVIAAAQEERFTRKKHDPAFPINAISYCLDFRAIDLSGVDAIVFYDKPFLTFDRLLETYLSYAPKGLSSFVKAMPLWLKDKLFLKKKLISELNKLDGSVSYDERLLFSEHHLSHAASAYYPSAFENAIVLTMDGVGEWATTSVAIGDKNNLDVVEEIHFPHSIGLFYSAITYYIGFKVNSGEYKVMGLAPYGEPKYVDKMKECLIDIKDDGSFWLNQEYFDYCTGLTMTNDKFSALFGESVRQPEDELTQFHMDIAASVQQITEEIVIKTAKRLREKYKINNLCLAGGVALNCVANGELLRSNIFDHVWVQPAAGDAGGAIGAALLAYYKHNNNPRKVDPENDSMSGSYLGPSFCNEEIERRLLNMGAKFDTLNEKDLINKTANVIVNERVVGWFQGRMEFGPRSLGNRSILGNPKSESTQKTMNLKIKYRESFRPFAPSVLSEDVSEWFDIDTESPYMLLVAPIKQNHRKEEKPEDTALFGINKLNVVRSDIPAVTHVDYSARIQTVHRKTNARYYDLISKVKEGNGCGVVVNTSFNVRGEPIVCSPEDAFRCFMGTEMDVLVVGDCFLEKQQQDPSLILDYKEKFELD